MMKQNIRKWMGVLFFLAMFTGVVFGVLPGTQIVAKADGPWTSGGCTVTLSGTTLRVSKTSGGNGKMENYAKDRCPWRQATVSSIIISEDVESIGTYAFQFLNTAAVTSVTINSTKIKEIPEGAFLWNDSLTQIILPDSVTTIGKEAFYQCTGLTSITAKGVQTIGESAFGNNYSLASVSIPAVTQIGEEVFLDVKV